MKKWIKWVFALAIIVTIFAVPFLTQIFIVILSWLLQGIGWIVMIQFFYLIFLSFFGFKNPKRDYELVPDQAKFLILIAAHNEEDVIENTLAGLGQIDYDPDLYEIVVVNDNSSDKTGEIVESLGYRQVNTSLQRFPREGVGKPGGIQYALRELGFESLIGNYDLLMILDADNHVSNNILKELNSQWLTKGKPEAIQSYLGVKNWDKVLSAGYAVNYWTTNRFFQLAKYRLGLPISIGGTGFVVRIDWLIWNGGFRYTSLTEDLEMEIKIVEDHGRILWNHFGQIFDEKPEKLNVAMVQRYRWAKGHWYVAMTNSRKLFKSFLSRGHMANIDQIMYLFSMAQVLDYFIFLLAMITSFIFFAMNSSNAAVVFANGLNQIYHLLIPSTWLTIGFGVYMFLFLPIYALLIDGKTKNVFKTVFVGLPYFSLTYLLDQFWGLIHWKDQGTWIRTPHEKKMSVEASEPVKSKKKSVVPTKEQIPTLSAKN